MAVTLDQLLTLAGRLDDAPGFDTPRERFRRFLTEHATNVETLGDLVHQCLRVPGEQHHRALQDLVATAGRFLGAAVTYGPAAPNGEGLLHQGLWNAGPLSVVLVVGGATPAEESVAALAGAITRVPGSILGASRVIGLLVATPQSASQDKLEAALAHAGPDVTATVVAVETLLSLARLVAGGHVPGADAMRLIRTGVAIDVVVDLVARATAPRAVSQPPVSLDVPAAPADVAEAPVYWLAGVVPDQAMSPEAFLELVVLRRQVFGLGDTIPSTGPIRPGDSLCFYIAGKGVVGRARVMSMMEDGSGMRDARRFRQILRLIDIALHVDRPVALDPESELRLRAVTPIGKRQTQTLLRVSYERYVGMTVPADRQDSNEPAASAPPAEPAAAS